MSQPSPEFYDDESWRALQDVLEERDREYWAGEEGETGVDNHGE